MKFFLLTFSTLLCFSAFAIGNSTLDKRHQEVIKKAVAEKCHLRKSTLKELNVVATPHRVDQGITDFNYLITLKAIEVIDQGIRDEYLVTIKSSYADLFDHQNGEWGQYYVDSVKCDLL